MPKPSARDLLRKTKEQKRRQQQQKRDTLSRPKKAISLEKSSQDSNAQMATNRHLKSTRSSNVKGEISATINKRAHNDVVDNDVSDNLEQQLKIASDIEVSAQADASTITDGEVTATKRRKVDFNNHSAEHTELDISSNEEGLPPGFFDEGIEPLEDDADMGNDDGNIAGTPAAQSKVSKPELSTTTPNKELLDDLAAFETEIAELVDPEEPLTDNLASTAVNQEDVLDGQAKEWSERTQHLAHLQSIIKQGLEELDPNESKSDMDEGSDESSEDEYSEFTSWRTGQL